MESISGATSISSIPTPAHCTADFCLIPVRRFLYVMVAGRSILV